MMSVSKLDLIFRKLITTKFYTKGWGTPNELMEILSLQKIISNREELAQFSGLLNDPVFFLKPPNYYQDYKVINGSFDSPICQIIPHLVPDKCKTAHFQFVTPRNSMLCGNYWPVCVHMASTGDHGFVRRRELLAKPLLKHGISSVILENPFYGSRKPESQIRSGLLQVKDLFIMGLSLVFEGHSILRWLDRKGYGPLGLTGISMGGHMASLAATSWSKPIAVIPCMSWSSSSAVWTDGVLSKAIPWHLLEAEYISNQLQSLEPKLTTCRFLNEADHNRQNLEAFSSVNALYSNCHAVTFMRNIMDEVTGLYNFSIPVDPVMATFVVATADAYYPMHGLKPMNEIWPGCEVRYLNTGHIAGFLMHHNDFNKAITDTFDRLVKRYRGFRSNHAVRDNTLFDGHVNDASSKSDS